MRRIRLDVLVHQRGLAESQEKARRLVLAGQVLVEGKLVDKVGARVAEAARIEVRRGLPYVSRGGLKLEKALRVFGVAPNGRVVADVGASTGGFTDCLLQHGAARVYAIDVGYGQLAWKLRRDPRVVVMERTNARYLATLPERVSLVTVDVSFISVGLILPQVRGWLSPGGLAVVLIKPQFEAPREKVGRGGVVRDEDTHREVLFGVLEWAAEHHWRLLGLTRSPLVGPRGNLEFLLCLGTDPEASGVSPAEAVEKALMEAG